MTTEKEKPKLRREAIGGFKYCIAEAVTKLLIRDSQYPFETCINCTHFAEKEEQCRLYKLRPPARIIAFGCKSYVDEDQIPF